MTEYSITPFVDMEQEHVADVARIERETFSQPWSESQIAGYVNRYGTIARVLVKDGKVVAYYSYNYVCGEGYINNIAVDGKERGKGYGTAIIKDILYTASMQELTAVTLEVRESNAAARSLYEKFGFVNSGVRKKFYDDGEDAVIYWLKLEHA